jgi:WD40 repeat protein
LGLTLFLVAAIGAAWFASVERNNAQTNFVAAERIRLAALAQIALDNGEGGDLPALLALRSLQHGYSPEADAALLKALSRGFTRQQYLGHSDGVLSADISPDGRYVLTASSDHTARLWDAQTGQELRQFSGHTAGLKNAVFSPDGHYALTGSGDNTARLWEVETGREVRQFSGHSGGVWGIAFTPDGQHIITSDEALARLWDVQSGAVVRQFSGHTGTIFWLDLSPDGRYLATFSGDKTARLWEVQSGRELGQFEGHTDWVGGGRFSPDGQYLLTTSADRTARLWNIETGQEMRRFVGHTDSLVDGVFSPDGRAIVTTSYDKTARLWDIASGREIRQFLGHTDFVSVPIFSFDGHYLLTASGDRTARLWEVEPATEPESLNSFVAHFDMSRLTLSPDQQLWLTGWTDGTVQVWSVSSSQANQTINLKTATINSQAISADNRLVLAGDSEGMVNLADVSSGQVTRQFVGHTGPVWDVVFSADGRYALSGGEDQTARLWEVATGQEIARLAGHNGPLRAVAFSPDGHFILSGSDDRTARLWDPSSGQEIRQFSGHTAAVLDVAFSKDGRFILTGSADNTARRWAVETGQALQEFAGHTDQVSQVAFSPDGRSVLTAGADQTARLWEAETGQVVRQLVGHTTPILFIDFSADGRFILSGDARITYRWQANLEEAIAFTCTHLSRDFSAAERVLYNITDTRPTCPEFARRTVEVEPTWTPVSPGSYKVSPLLLSVDMAFMSESANISMNLPIQDAFIEAGNDQVVRPTVLNEETLALPVYRTAVEVELDFFEAPFETGPYPQGEPLGFTLGDYVAAEGHGTYVVQGDRAAVALTFDRLVPHGLYTVWCVTLFFSTASIAEYPCLAPDGTMYSFTADETGHAAISMDIAAFPPSTSDTVYEIAIAYHSDGKTHGGSAGEHGRNVHAQMFFDFLPPDGHPGPLPIESRLAEDSSAVAREWMQLLVDRVQADRLSPPLASRIYAYEAVTLYEAVGPGMSGYKSLQGQLNGLPELPQAENGPYDWPAVAASAGATVAAALLESPGSQAAVGQLRDQQLAGLEQSGVTADILARSTNYGQSLGQAIVAWLETDGYRELKNKPYTPPTGPGFWVPTSTSQTRPAAPYWGELRPFTLSQADACEPADPLPYSEEPTSDFYAQARQVYDTSQSLTAEQKAIALFWADTPGMTGTPPGHWVSLVNQIAAAQQLPLDQTVELHALVGIGLADAFISCWQEKYTVSLIRPESYIQQHLDPDWEPLIPTPPFPEYTSGHSVASAAAAEILTGLLGVMPFIDTTHESRGLGRRSFASFTAAAEEAAISRLYGGIHYRMAIDNGLTQGRCIGRTVLERLQTH